MIEQIYNNTTAKVHISGNIPKIDYIYCLQEYYNKTYKDK